MYLQTKMMIFSRGRGRERERTKNKHYSDDLHPDTAYVEYFFLHFLYGTSCIRTLTILNMIFVVAHLNVSYDSPLMSTIRCNPASKCKRPYCFTSTTSTVFDFNASKNKNALFPTENRLSHYYRKRVSTFSRFVANFVIALPLSPVKPQPQHTEGRQVRWSQHGNLSLSAHTLPRQSSTNL